MPKCEKCSSQPEMVVVKREPFFGMGGTNAAQRFQMTSNLRRSGHPLMAAAGGLLSGAAWLTNQLLETVHYKCKICGTITSQTEGK